MDFRRMICFLRRTVRRKPTVKQESLLLDLPLDLVHYIFDGFQWPEKVTLSQTCRDLWCILRQRCSSSRRKTTAQKRMEHLTALACLLPDHYLCASCRALHLIDHRDLPIIRYDGYGKKLYRTPCPSPEPSLYLHYYFDIAFHHVHLATKYSRMEGVHQSYRANIMQKSVHSSGHCLLGLDVVTEPRIVRGRFILKVSYTFRALDGELSFSALKQTFVYFCPHNTICHIELSLDTLITSLRLAYRQPRDRFGSRYGRFSCDRCPSDYSILIEDKRVFISVHSDLGTGNSPTDPYWRSHIHDKDNNQVTRQKFSYKHGSIEKMFYSCDT